MISASAFTELSPLEPADVALLNEARNLLDDDIPRHVLVDIADVTVRAGLRGCLEGLRLVLCDVPGIELPTRGGQRMRDAVLVGYCHGRPGLHGYIHAVKHEVRDRYVDARSGSGARGSRRRPRCTCRGRSSATSSGKENGTTKYQEDRRRKDAAEDTTVPCH